MQTWLETQENILGIKFNSVINLFNNVETVVNAALKKQKVLLIGGTGVGKSTLVNYLNGTKYKVAYDDAGHLYASRVGGIVEIAKTGQGMVSETLYPQIIETKNLSYVYCDLAGLFDTKGAETRICASNSVHLLSCVPGDIKAIIVVLDVDGFIANKGQSFKETALVLARVTHNNPELLDIVEFVITKPKIGSKVSPAAIIEKYIKGILVGKDGLESKAKVKILDVDEQNLLLILQQMASRVEQFIVADVCDAGNTKELLEQKIAKHISRNGSDYDFLSIDSNQISFNNLLIKLSCMFSENLHRLEVQLPKELQLGHEEYKNSKSSIDVLNLKIKANVEVRNNNKTQTATAKQKINTLQDEVKKLQGHISRTKCQGCHHIIEARHNEILSLERSINDYALSTTVLETDFKLDSETLNATIEMKEAQIRKISCLESEIKTLRVRLVASRELIKSIFEITHKLNMGLIPEINHFWLDFDPYIMKSAPKNIKFQFRS